MSTLVGTLSAVTALLSSLAPGTFAAVHNGQQERLDAFPCAEVMFGPATKARRQPDGFLERQTARTGIVRISVERVADLPVESALLPPLIDVVDAAFGVAPHLDGTVDRFDMIGHGAAAVEQVGEKKTVYVDVSWQAIDAEAGAYVQDW